MKIIRKLVLITLLFLGQNAFCQLVYSEIDIDNLLKLLNTNEKVLLLDVRTAAEFEDRTENIGLRIGRLKNAINIPNGELEKRLQELAPYKNDKIVVYCSHSSRSRSASRLLVKNGFSNVFNLKAGLSELHA